MKNLSQLMKQAQEMKDKMATIQESLADVEVEGMAGAGLVKVLLDGKGKIRSVNIDVSLVNAEEIGILEDLIAAAHNDAKTKMDVRIQEETEKLMGGFSLPPGIKFPF